METVLLVDDDEAVVEALAEFLEDEGFEVVTAADGRAALDHLRRGVRPCAILLDLMMPGMNGWDFFDELQRDPRLKKIPVVVATAGEGTLHGAAATLSKVAELHELLAVVRRHLG